MNNYYVKKKNDTKKPERSLLLPFQNFSGLPSYLFTLYFVSHSSDKNILIFEAVFHRWFLQRRFTRSRGNVSKDEQNLQRESCLKATRRDVWEDSKTGLQNPRHWFSSHWKNFSLVQLNKTKPNNAVAKSFDFNQEGGNLLTNRTQNTMLKIDF